MPRRDIALDTIHGKLTVRAATYGLFGVHPAQWGGTFVVTHIPTGRAITYGAPSEEHGLRLARMLTCSGARWSFQKVSLMPKKAERIGRAVLERWREAIDKQERSR